MATSIWDVATEGASAFDIVGGYMSDVALSYEDRAAIDVATESDTGFVDYINECQMALMDNTSKTFAQESVLAIQVAKGMDYSTAMEGLKSTIRNAWEAIKEFLQKIWETIKEYVKKAKDWLARRASLGKALITKYSSVLRNKRVSESLKFDWCAVDIKAFTDQRANWMAKILPAYGSTASTTVASLNGSFQTIKKKQEEIATEEAKGTSANDAAIKAAKDAIDAELKKLRESGLDSQSSGDYYSTQGIAEDMRNKLYKNNNGPQYEQKSWSDIKNDVMAWADMDPSRYLTEALGIFEKDSNAMMKIIKEQQKNMEDALDDEKKSSAIDKKVESGIRAVIRRCAAGGAKIHKMYITHLKEAISIMQTQAIAAARKAILDKGTTNANESYVFNDVDMIY